MDKLRFIDADAIADAVEDMVVQANINLRGDAAQAIRHAAETEKNPIAAETLCQLVDNARIARETRLPVCQDTGMAVVFVDIGQSVHIHGDLQDAVNRGVRRGYRRGYLRNSVVSDPLYRRQNTGDNTPCIMHCRFVSEDQARYKIKIEVSPKGFGSENVSAVKMLTPSHGEQDVIDFVADVVCKAGGNPCPPLVIGVGIGGDFELCALMAKRALLREIGSHNSDAAYAALELAILQRVNATGIGPMGWGGDTTALQASVEWHPTHIAGLPVAVNVCCHAVRGVSREL